MTTMTDDEPSAIFHNESDATVPPAAQDWRSNMLSWLYIGISMYIYTRVYIITVYAYRRLRYV